MAEAKVDTGAVSPPKPNYSEWVSSAVQGASSYLARRNDPNGDVQNPQGGSGLDKLMGEAGARLQSYKGENKGNLALAEVVDTLVNERVTYTREGIDNWQTGAHTANRGKGDCDDFAILKAEMLVNMGVPASQVGVLILAAKDPNDPKASGHAVCTYTDNDGQVYVLNNEGAGKDRLGGMQKLEDYLQSDVTGGTRYAPAAMMNIANGKITPTAAGFGDPAKPQYTLAQLEGMDGFRQMACQVVANQLGQGVTADQVGQAMDGSKKEFADKLREALKDDKNLPAGTSSAAKEALRQYADLLAKSDQAPKVTATVDQSAPDGAAQPKSRSMTIAEAIPNSSPMIVQGSGKLTAQALEDAGQKETSMVVVEPSTGQHGPATTPQHVLAAPDAGAQVTVATQANAVNNPNYMNPNLSNQNPKGPQMAMGA